MRINTLSIEPRRSDLIIAVSAFLSSRLILLLAGWVTLSFVSKNNVSANAHQLMDLACRWDCGWYMSIAAHGYSAIWPANQPYAVNLAFWPAFPFAARFLSHASGLPILICGCILANCAFLFALYFFCGYAKTIGFEQKLAGFATFLMAFSPQSFIFSAFYGDAFGLLGVVGGIYFARRKRWWISGLYALLATSSRPTGVLLITYLLIYAYEQLGWRGFFKPWIDPRPLIPIFLLPAGHFLAFWIAHVASGDAFAQDHSRIAGWGASFEAPWSAIRANFSQGPDFFFWTTSALVLSLSIIPLYRAKLFPEATFTFFSFLLVLSGNEANSMLRYAVAVPTVFIGFSWMLRDNEIYRLSLLSIFASLGAVIFCAWAMFSRIAM